MAPLLMLAFVAPAVADDVLTDAPALDRDRAAVVRTAVKRVTPFIVTIETIGGTDPAGGRGPARQRPGGFRVADGPTTGLVWSRDGLILTSSFNFVRDPRVITVVLSDGSRHVARLLARDTIRRLALLRIEADDLPAAEWAPSSELKVGQYAIACGRGFGGPTPAVSVGIISALGRRGGNALQTDARISPANYGGPLIDVEGRVLGICVPLPGSGGELAGVEWYDSGIGFAVPLERIQRVADRLAAGVNIEPGKIGVVLAEARNEENEEDESPARIVIVAVASPSPAEGAGLQPEDIIVALNRQPVGDIAELQRRLADLEAGQKITLTIDRDGDQKDIALTLARPADIGPVRMRPDAPTTAPTTQPRS